MKSRALAHASPGLRRTSDPASAVTIAALPESSAPLLGNVRRHDSPDADFRGVFCADDHGQLDHSADHLAHSARSDGSGRAASTGLFRGKIASLIALEHLYHLENHLYPMVPHQNWPKLARRLDPYFKTAGLTPIILGM